MSATAATRTPASDRLAPQVTPAARLDSVDLLRGVVMVLMALDHARDYFTIARFDPTDLSQTTPGLFLTRWITHVCAPVFVFLAGASAFLYGSRGRSRGELARFLVTRGLWLVVLEFTVVRWAWMFNFDYTNLLFVQVIWVLGISMIVLAGLIYLPLWATALVGVVMIAGHNLFDGTEPQALGSLQWLWSLLHVQGPTVLPGGINLFVVYPLIPWIGVMAAGYAFGRVLLLPAQERRRVLLRLGGALTLGFILLRASNLYGDPRPWSEQGEPIYTVLSFLNTTKYPPSLLFLLMTLGPALLALPLFERLRGAPARFFIVYGRVPLFYYVLHLFLVHALALAVALMVGFDARSFLQSWLTLPEDWGFGLPVVYLVWAFVVLALYPVCRWFAGVKARRRDPWLSYL